MSSAYENACNEVCGNLKLLFPCYYESPDFSSGHWVCSNTPMNKTESIAWLKKNRGELHSFKILTSVPGPTKQFCSNWSPFNQPRSTLRPSSLFKSASPFISSGEATSKQIFSPSAPVPLEFPRKKTFNTSHVKKNHNVGRFKHLKKIPAKKNAKKSSIHDLKQNTEPENDSPIINLSDENIEEENAEHDALDSPFLKKRISKKPKQTRLSKKSRISVICDEDKEKPTDNLNEYQQSEENTFLHLNKDLDKSDALQTLEVDLETDDNEESDNSSDQKDFEDSLDALPTGERRQEQEKEFEEEDENEKVNDSGITCQDKKAIMYQLDAIATSNSLISKLTNASLNSFGHEGSADDLIIGPSLSSSLSSSSSSLPQTPSTDKLVLADFQKISLISSLKSRLELETKELHLQEALITASYNDKKELENKILQMKKKLESIQNALYNKTNETKDLISKKFLIQDKVKKSQTLLIDTQLDVHKLLTSKGLRMEDLMDESNSASYLAKSQLQRSPSNPSPISSPGFFPPVLSYNVKLRSAPPSPEFTQKHTPLGNSLSSSSMKSPLNNSINVVTPSLPINLNKDLKVTSPPSYPLQIPPTQMSRSITLPKPIMISPIKTPMVDQLRQSEPGFAPTINSTSSQADITKNTIPLNLPNITPTMTNIKGSVLNSAKPLVTMKPSDQNNLTILFDSTMNKKSSKMNSTTPNNNRSLLGVTQQPQLSSSISKTSHFESILPIDAFSLVSSGINVLNLDDNNIFPEKPFFASKNMLANQNNFKSAENGLPFLQCFSGFAPQFVEKKSTSLIIQYPIFENLGYLNLTPTHRSLMRIFIEPGFDNPFLLSHQDFFLQFSTYDWENFNIFFDSLTPENINLNPNLDILNNVTNLAKVGDFFYGLDPSTILSCLHPQENDKPSKITGVNCGFVFDINTVINILVHGSNIDSLIQYPYFLQPKSSFFLTPFTREELELNSNVQSCFTYMEVSMEENMSNIFRPVLMKKQNGIVTNFMGNDTLDELKPAPGSITDVNLVSSMFNVYQFFFKFYSLIDKIVLQKIIQSTNFNINSLIGLIQKMTNNQHAPDTEFAMSYLFHYSQLIAQISNIWKSVLNPFSVSSKRVFSWSFGAYANINQENISVIEIDEIAISLLYHYSRKCAAKFRLLKSDDDFDNLNYGVLGLGVSSVLSPPSSSSGATFLNDLNPFNISFYDDLPKLDEWFNKTDEIILRNLQMKKINDISYYKQILDIIFNHPLTSTFVNLFMGNNLNQHVISPDGKEKISLSLINLNQTIFCSNVPEKFRTFYFPKKIVWFVLNGFRDNGSFLSNTAYESIYITLQQNYMQKIHPIFMHIILSQVYNPKSARWKAQALKKKKLIESRNSSAVLSGSSKSEFITEKENIGQLDENDAKIDGNSDQNIENDMVTIKPSELLSSDVINFKSLKCMFFITKNISVEDFCEKNLTSNAATVVTNIFYNQSISEYDPRLSVDSFCFFVSSKRWKNLLEYFASSKSKNKENREEFISNITNAFKYPEKADIINVAQMLAEFTKFPKSRGRPTNDVSIHFWMPLTASDCVKLTEQFPREILSKILVDHAGLMCTSSTGDSIKPFTIYIQNLLQECSRFKRGIYAELSMGNHLQHPYYLMRIPRTNAPKNSQGIKMPSCVPPYPFLTKNARKMVKHAAGEAIDSLLKNNSLLTYVYPNISQKETESLKVYSEDLRNPELVDTLMPVNGWSPDIINRIEKTKISYKDGTLLTPIYEQPSPKILIEDLEAAKCVDCLCVFRLKTPKGLTENAHDDNELTAKKRNYRPCAGYVPCGCMEIKRCVGCYISRWVYAVNEYYTTNDSKNQLLSEIENNPNKLMDIINFPFTCPECKDNCYINTLYVISFDDLVSYVRGKINEYDIVTENEVPDEMNEESSEKELLESKQKAKQKTKKPKMPKAGNNLKRKAAQMEEQEQEAEDREKVLDYRFTKKQKVTYEKTKSGSNSNNHSPTTSYVVNQLPRIDSRSDFRHENNHSQLISNIQPINTQQTAQLQNIFQNHQSAPYQPPVSTNFESLNTNQNQGTNNSVLIDMNNPIVPPTPLMSEFLPVQTSESNNEGNMFTVLEHDELGTYMSGHFI